MGVLVFWGLGLVIVTSCADESVWEVSADVGILYHFYDVVGAMPIGTNGRKHVKAGKHAGEMELSI